MHAIILAGGRGTRLAGAGVPAYMKPLVLINGEPLIVSVANVIGRLPVTHITVVAALENIEMLARAFDAYYRGDAHVQFILQDRRRPESLGALSTGLRAVQYYDTAVAVLCGDNTLTRTDWSALLAGCSKGDCVSVVPVREVVEPRRLTLLRKVGEADDDDEYCDIEVCTPDEPMFSDDIYGARRLYAWVGPIISTQGHLSSAIDNVRRDNVMPDIVSATALPKVLRHIDRPFLVETSCTDIGIPEAL